MSLSIETTCILIWWYYSFFKKYFFRLFILLRGLNWELHTFRWVNCWCICHSCVSRYLNLILLTSILFIMFISQWVMFWSKCVASDLNSILILCHNFSWYRVDIDTIIEIQWILIVIRLHHWMKFSLRVIDGCQPWRSYLSIVYRFLVVLFHFFDDLICLVWLLLNRF